MFFKARTSSGLGRTTENIKYVSVIALTFANLFRFCHLLAFNDCLAMTSEKKLSHATATQLR